MSDYEEDRRMIAAQELEANRRQAWITDAIRQADAKGLTPAVVYASGWLDQQIAPHMAKDSDDPAAWPPDVRPSDFDAYSRLNQVAAVNWLGDEPPPMVKQLREMEAHRARMDALPRE